MSDSSNFFIAFSGRPDKGQRKKTRVSRNISIWNLQKFSKKELVTELRKKIPLLSHLKPKGKYKTDFIPKEIELTWGILVEDKYWRDGISVGADFLAICNFFSDIFLNPLFTVDYLGIRKWFPILTGHKQHNYWKQNKYNVFAHKNFSVFYDFLKTETEYLSLSVYNIERWIKEPDMLKKTESWRIFLAFILFNDLSKYDYGKEAYTHLKEVLDTAIILELLLTEENEKYISKKLKQRSKLLLESRHKDIGIEIKNLYKKRCAFAHGSHYLEIAKKAKLDADGNYTFPDIDFYQFEKYRNYTRLILILYIFLNREIKVGNIKEKSAYLLIKNGANPSKKRQIKNALKKILPLIPI